MHTGLAHKVAEGGQIGVPQVVERRTRIEGMTHTLGTAVHGKMLGTGHSLQVMRVVALQTVHHGHAHLACQVGVLTVGLLSASPPWVAEDIYVGSPHRETMESCGGHTAALLLVPFGTCLIAGSCEHPLHQRYVEGGSHAYRLWKNSDVALVGQSMKSLTPPTELSDAESGYGR